MVLLNSLAAYSQDTIVCIVKNNTYTSSSVCIKSHQTFPERAKANSPIFVNPYNDLNRVVFGKSAKYNYLAAYNIFTNGYDFYPSEVVLNFNINSPRVANQRFAPIKVDSFNPHGVKKTQTAISLGLVNLLLEELQK